MKCFNTTKYFKQIILGNLFSAFRHVRLFVLFLQSSNRRLNWIVETIFQRRLLVSTSLTDTLNRQTISPSFSLSLSSLSQTFSLSLSLSLALFHSPSSLSHSNSYTSSSHSFSMSSTLCIGSSISLSHSLSLPETHTLSPNAVLPKLNVLSYTHPTTTASVHT